MQEAFHCRLHNKNVSITCIQKAEAESSYKALESNKAITFQPCIVAAWNIQISSLRYALLAYTRHPEGYKKHQTQICTSRVKYLKLSGQKAMLLKLKNISKKHEYHWKGKATGIEIVPASYWISVCQLIFGTSCYTGTLPAAITSNCCPFPCTQILSCRNFVGSNPNNIYQVLDLHNHYWILLLLPWATCNTDWLILDHWNISKKTAVKTIMTQPCTEFSKSTVYFLLMIFYYFTPAYFAKLTRLQEDPVLGALPFAIKQLLCEHCQLSRPAQKAGMWPLLVCTVLTTSQSTDLEQLTTMSNKAGVNPQPPTTSWLLAHGKAWLCASRGEDTSFSALKYTVPRRELWAVQELWDLAVPFSAPWKPWDWPLSWATCHTAASCLVTWQNVHNSSLTGLLLQDR